MIYVYIAGPFSPSKEDREFIEKRLAAGVFTAQEADVYARECVDANIRRVVDVGIEVARLGFFPVMPHANTAHPMFEKVQDYPFWIEGTLGLMERSDVLLLIERWRESSGARKERDRQEELGKPVFYSVRELYEWGKCRGCDGLGEREHMFTMGVCHDCRGRKVRDRP